MNEKIRKRCYQRVRAILNTELNSSYWIEANNALDIPVVTHSSNIVYWTIPDIKKMDMRIRKFLTYNRMHHSKTDVDWLYVLRCDGGRRMIQVEMAFKKYKGNRTP